MKKKRLFVWALTLVCTILSFSCKDDKDDSSGNVIADNYFTINKASFVDDYLPVGGNNLLSNFNVGGVVVKGGTSIVSFTSAEKLETVYVGVKGRTGYYEQKIEEYQPTQSSTGFIYYYEVSLKIKEEIEVSDFIVTVSALAPDGRISYEYAKTITIENNSKNNLSNYFSVGSASFVNNTQPTGVEDFINNFSVGNSVVKGGSLVLTFTSMQEFTKILIGMPNVVGYYEQTITQYPTVIVGNGYEYYYETQIFVSQDIDVNYFQISVTAETESKYISKAYTSRNISVTTPVVGNPIEDYFTLQGGTFVSEDLPAGTEKMINNLSVNEYAINGGASLVSFTSKESFREIYVGVVGERGYYKQIVGEYPIADNGEISYQVLLNINEDINKGSFKAQIAAKTDDGRISSQTSTENISIIEVGTGDLQISLTWDQLDDVDLHVVDPYNNHIYYASRYSFSNQDEVYFYFYCYVIQLSWGVDTSYLNPANQNHWNIVNDYVNEFPDQVWSNYWDLFEEYLKNNPYPYHGFLDLDSNAGCSGDGINNENIYFENPVGGTYSVYVDLYSKCYTPAGAQYTVTVRYKGQIIDQQTKQFSHYNQGSGNDSEQYVFIGSYDIDGTRAGIKPSEQNPYQLYIQDMLNAK